MRTRRSAVAQHQTWAQHPGFEERAPEWEKRAWDAGETQERPLNDAKKIQESKEEKKGTIKSERFLKYTKEMRRSRREQKQKCPHHTLPKSLGSVGPRRDQEAREPTEDRPPQQHGRRKLKGRIWKGMKKKKDKQTEKEKQC